MDYKTAPPVLRDFLTYLETIMGRSRSTVQQYYLDLRIFFRFLLQHRSLVPKGMEFDKIDISTVDIDFVASVTKSEVLDFLVFAANDRPKFHKSSETPYGNQQKARARKLSAIRGLYKFYCDKQGVLKDNPTNGLDSPKQMKSLPKFLTLQESIDLLSSANEGPYAERDYCILTLFLNCGMRVSELVAINLGDISENRLRLLGKGNKERIVYLNEACIKSIDDYMPTRITPKTGHKNALFISRIGRRIDVQTVKWIVDKYLKKAGLAHKKLSVHKLRHTAATLMYQNGVDVRALKEVLGHENLDTTMIYTHVMDSNIREAAEANPLAGIKKSGKKNT